MRKKIIFFSDVVKREGPTSQECWSHPVESSIEDLPAKHEMSDNDEDDDEDEDNEDSQDPHGKELFRTFKKTILSNYQSITNSLFEKIAFG